MFTGPQFIEAKKGKLYINNEYLYNKQGFGIYFTIMMPETWVELGCSNGQVHFRTRYGWIAIFKPYGR